MWSWAMLRTTVPIPCGQGSLDPPLRTPRPVPQLESFLDGDQSWGGLSWGSSTVKQAPRGA